jgi:serine/threonine protein kinase
MNEARVALHVADGLQAAHEAGLVHRDVKPDNIIIDQAGTAQIMDFGVVLDDRDDVLMTAEGVIPGTPAYMSPEQILSPSDVGASSDIYSLGITLSEMLAGRPVYDGNPQSIVGRIVDEIEPSFCSAQAQIPHGLESICMRAMYKKPEQRYASARELSTDLRHWIRLQRRSANPSALSARIRSADLLKRTVFTTAALMSLVGLILIVIWLSEGVIDDTHSASARTVVDQAPPTTPERTATPSEVDDLNGRGQAMRGERPTVDQWSTTDRLDTDAIPSDSVRGKPNSQQGVNQRKLDQVRRALEAKLAQGNGTVALRLELARVRVDLASTHRRAQQTLQAFELLQAATRCTQGIETRDDAESTSQHIDDVARIHFAIGKEFFEIDKLGYAREAFERAKLLWIQLTHRSSDNAVFESRLRATDQALEQVNRDFDRQSNRSDQNRG